MASFIVTDLYAVQNFRGQLEDTAKNLREQLRKTEASIDTVAKGWKDIQFDQFKEGIEQDKEIIEPLCKEIDEFNNEILYKFEKIIEKYLNLGR